MHISLIASVDKNYGIGKDNKLLQHISEDFTWFKKHTKNRVVVMGRATYESLPKKPLPKRLNVVLTRDTTYNPHPDVQVYHDIASVIHEFRHEPELMVIGGASIYEQFLPHTNRIYLTELDKEFEADSFFPTFDKKEFIRYFHLKGEEEVGFDYSFNVYKKMLK